MQILHFCPLPLYSGLEQYALLMARQQQALGHDVTFVTLKNSALEKECESVGIKTILVDFPATTGTLTPARQYQAILANYPELDVIHLHTSRDIPRLGLAMQFVKWKFRLTNRKWRRPKIIQQNHIWMSHSKRDPIHWLTYRQLDEVWGSSEPAKKDLIRYLPVPESRIHIVKYGRDLSVRQSFLSRKDARNELGLPEDAVVLGAIARIDQGKGVWELIEGAVQVMKSEPRLHLVIIGGPTMSDPQSIVFSEKVENYVASLSPEIASRIHLTGAIRDAARLLKAMDIYAQVSYKETFSLALLDAQLAGLPVLGTNSGGTPEVVREGKTGWLCEPENASSLAGALTRALQDHDHWQSFGETAQKRVEREFNLETVIQTIMDRYSATL